MCYSSHIIQGGERKRNARYERRGGDKPDLGCESTACTTFFRCTSRCTIVFPELFFSCSRWTLLTPTRDDNAWLNNGGDTRQFHYFVFSTRKFTMLRRMFRSVRIMNRLSDFGRDRQSFFRNLFKFLYELENDRKSFSLLLNSLLWSGISF